MPRPVNSLDLQKIFANRASVSRSRGTPTRHSCAYLSSTPKEHPTRHLQQKPTARIVRCRSGTLMTSRHRQDRFAGKLGLRMGAEVPTESLLSHGWELRRTTSLALCLDLSKHRLRIVLEDSEMLEVRRLLTQSGSKGQGGSNDGPPWLIVGQPP